MWPETVDTWLEVYRDHVRGRHTTDPTHMPKAH